MPKYTQTVKFEREFVIEAPDAASANEKLEEEIRSAEWSADVRAEGWEDFEDEPVTCPKCSGLGTIVSDTLVDQECDQCKGDGVVPFAAKKEAS